MSINSVQDIDAETVGFLQEIQNSPKMSVVTNEALLSAANEQCFDRNVECAVKPPSVDFTPPTLS